MSQLVNRYDVRLIFHLAKYYADLLKMHHHSKPRAAEELSRLMGRALDLAHELTEEEAFTCTNV